MKLRTILIALVSLAWPSLTYAACLDAQQLAAEPLTGPDTGNFSSATRRDRGGRMVAPVMVNGHGPFNFVVDTGANRSAISQALVTELGLGLVGSGEVHSIHQVMTAPMAGVNSLNYGEMQLGAASLPVLDGPMLAGQQGLLGVDGMRGQRLRMDFEDRCIEIAPSRNARRLPGWTAVHGQLRFGRLIVIQGYIQRQRINVLIDTGSDSTLANPALRERLSATVRDNNSLTNLARNYTAGTPVVLDVAILIPKLTVGSVEVHRIVAYVGSFHVFDLWGMTHEPTLLVGMDVLSQTRAIAIDYETGTVFFRMRPAPQTGSRLTDGGNNRITGITH